MKKMKKIMALVIAMVMVLAMGVTVFAAAPTTGTITVNNTPKGEVYAVYKVLDATINNTGGINYTGTIPTEFANIFETQTVGTAPNTYSAIGVKDGVTQDQINAALKDYVKNKESAASFDAVVAAKTFANATSKQTASANSVSFDVAPGFYVVVSSQGTTVMADSATDPATSINEKNTTIPTADKKVDKESYSIGDTINYTGKFDTSNWLGEGDAAKQVTKYVISDTLPDFISDVAIDSLEIYTPSGNADDPDTPADESLGTKVGEIENPAFTNKAITVPWATWVEPVAPETQGHYDSKYANGVIIVIKYHGTLTDTTNVNTADTNTITISPYVWEPDDNEEKPWNETWSKDAVIKTYGAALKKVDGSSNPLKGAEFTIKGLTVAAVDGEPGVYRVTAYNANSTTPSATLTTNDNGELYIIGLASDVTLKVTETKAPDGYNKLDGETDLTPQQLTEALWTASGEKHFDAKGNLVSQSSSETTTETMNKNYTMLEPDALKIVNNKGTELPSTGGIGTTIFYVVGAILVIGAGILLVTRRRINAE